MSERGRNSGITGLVDLPGINARFQGRIYGYGHSLSVQERARRGRASNKFPVQRMIAASGDLVLDGDVRLDCPPLPNAWTGQDGTVTIQLHTDKTVAIPVRITNAGFKFNEKTQDTHRMTLTARVTGFPTWSGFGASVSATSPTPSDLEVYDGTDKVFDPDGLENKAHRTIDIWGSLADTDAGEYARIASVIASATAPVSGHKLRSATFARDSDDGGRIVLDYALTTSGEEQILSHTSTRVDPDNLDNSAATAAWSPDTPPTPSGTGWIKTDTQTIKFNDSKTLTVFIWSLRTRKQGIEMDGTETLTDPTGIVSRAQITQVVTDGSMPSAPAAPTGLELYSTLPKQLVPNGWKYTWEYRVNNEAHNIEGEGTWPEDDPSDLGDVERVCITTTTSTPPSTPTPTLSGLKLRRKTGPKDIGYQRFEWHFTFAQNTEADDITLGGSVKVVDPQGLGSKERITALNTSSTAPAFSPTVAMVQREVSSKQLTSGSGVYQHTAEYGVRNTKDDIEMPGSPAFYSLNQPNLTRNTTVVASTTNVDTYAAARHAALCSPSSTAGARYRAIHVERSDPAHLVETTFFSADSRHTTGQFWTDTRPLDAKLSTPNGGSIQVFLADRLTRGTGICLVRIEPIYIITQRGRIRLRSRRYSNPNLQIYRSRMGTTNNAPFQGLPIGTVMYVGPDYDFKRGDVAAPCWDDFDYSFLYDSNGHFQATGFRMGWFETTYSGVSSLTPGGLINASNLGWSSGGALAKSDFSVFTA